MARIAKKTRLADDWYYGSEPYAGSSFSLPPGPGHYLGLSLHEWQGLPDGVVTVKMLVRGKPAAQRSIQLTTVSC